ncbi:MAG: exodeoxyribonuclease VII small subunit [Clostridia bacterium]|nr:exodeoxyribonuclease VII small subunit [Clostridia bacterium]
MEMTFENALARLEQVVRELEGGKAPLDTMLALFEEGKNLVDFCEKALTSAEQRVLKVTENGDTVPFENKK